MRKKESNPKSVCGELSKQGLFEEANIDKYEVQKVMRFAIEDHEYSKKLRKEKDANWRVIFNIHYDVLRELCDQLIRFHKQKISNHRGLFAFIIINFPDLELDWKYFEMIRLIRNQNKYEGRDITMAMWKQLELQFDVYVSTLKKEIEKRLKEL